MKQRNRLHSGPTGRSVVRAISLALLALSVASCAANRTYKETLDEREAEIKQLREERTDLKGDMRDLNSQKESLETALAEANARVVDAPKTGAQSFPELDRVGVTYGMRDGEMVLSVPSEITFGSGKADLSKSGQAALDQVAKTLLREYPDAEFWIEGHTDTDKISKSKYGTNRELSVARAMAVLRYLVEDAGVPDERCVIAGWGPYRPLAKNDSSATKAKNRRVEIVVHKVGKP